ncbi:MAG: PrgI family protein [bacterium]
MQYQIPQDVEVADKIIGPLTLKQFMYLIAGTGFGLAIYAALRNTIIPIVIIVILALIPVGIFAIIGFFRVNGRPLDSYIAPFFGFMGVAKRRFWQREDIQINQEEEIKKLRAESEKNSHPLDTRSQQEVSENIASLATLVDTGIQAPLPKEPKTVFDVDEERGSKIKTLLQEKAASAQVGREPLVSQMASVSPGDKMETIDKEIPNVNLEEKIQSREDHV